MKLAFLPFKTQKGLFGFICYSPASQGLPPRDKPIGPSPSLHPYCIFLSLSLRVFPSCRCDPATAGDRLSAYDGLNTHDSKLAHFCGLHNGPQVVSHGNTLLVHFQSDKDGRTAQGFAADYIFVLKWSVQPTKIIQEPMRGDQTSKAGPGECESRDGKADKGMAQRPVRLSQQLIEGLAAGLWPTLSPL